MKHILSVVVENRPGVLARVVGLISGAAIILTANVAPTGTLPLRVSHGRARR